MKDESIMKSVNDEPIVDPSLKNLWITTSSLFSLKGMKQLAKKVEFFIRRGPCPKGCVRNPDTGKCDC